jgi:hypothetical protein
MIVELAGDDLVGDLDDRLCPPRLEHAEFEIGFRCCPLDDRKRRDQRARHAFLADAEVDARALGLRAPVPIGYDFDRPHGIGLDARFHCRRWSTDDGWNSFFSACRPPPVADRSLALISS